MKRPGPVTASIVAMACLVFLGILLFVIFMTQSSIITAISMWPFIFTIAGIVDIIFLCIRRRWVYSFNIVCIASALLFCELMIIWAGVRYPRPHAAGLMAGLMMLVPIGLLIWLLVAFVRHPKIKEYLSRSAEGYPH